MSNLFTIKECHYDKFWIIIYILTFTSFGYAAENSSRYTILKNGAYFQTDRGLLRVEFILADIVRLQYTEEDDFLGNGTIVCIERSENKVPFQTRKRESTLSLISDSLIVEINLKNYSVTYRNSIDNKLLLSERRENPRESERIYIENVTYNEQSRKIISTADGKKEIMDVLSRDTIGHSWKYRNFFQWSEEEAIYGLGSHMEDYLNLRGKELYLCQHNLKAMVPVLNSTAGYGLLFDSGCGMIYSDKNGKSFIEVEASKQIDYYFMKGNTMDGVIAKYRFLTGNSPMMPKYIFGYIQSKERYTSSKEIIDVVTEYRKRQIPLDIIVQDWNYWPEGWGYMKMDPRYYPSPANLADSIHQLNAKLMVSIWPNPTNCPQTDDFEKKGFMLKRSIYDAYNPLARKAYWMYANNEFFNNGFDAWWCDCTEPIDADWGELGENYGWDSHQKRWEKNLALQNEVLGAERSTTFSLYHSKGIYENQRLTSSQKRVVNLTRSSYAGQQRYATISWNGDTHASWKSFAQQIPSGLNFMATGCPYWTVDIGAFFTQNKEQWFWNGDFPKGVDDLGYREFYTRMLQYAAFLPVFRSHGTDTPREIWHFGKPGEPFYDSILKMIKLRYRLLPYIYSLSGKITHEQYTMSRLLAFDFSNDANVFDIKDEFMFGPAFLVSPVTTPMYYDKGSVKLKREKKKNVYLPKGTNWIDFWTDKSYKGGQSINVDAPIDKIPLFVRQGSIIPIGPAVQHTGELQGKNLELAIYPGKDTRFVLYEDEGDNYNYEQGAFSTIELIWNDKAKTLMIGKRKGEFIGMEKVRTICVILHDHGRKQTKNIQYAGDETYCVF